MSPGWRPQTASAVPARGHPDCRVAAMNTPISPAPPSPERTPRPATEDASVAGEEDPGAAVDDGAGRPPVPDVPVDPQRPDAAPGSAG